jgi:hypothetical protein
MIGGRHRPHGQPEIISPRHLPDLLITEDPVRRLTAVITALALSPAPLAVAFPVTAAHATVTGISAGTRPMDGAYQIWALIRSDQVIKRVEATVRHPDGGTETVGDFGIVERLPGAYEATAATLVKADDIGDHVVDISVWDASGTRSDRAAATTIRRRLSIRFEGVTVAPAQIDIVDDEVTVSGRLLRSTVEGGEQPYPGATVTVQDLPYTFTTDAQGAFSGKIRLGGRRSVTVISAYGPVYFGAATEVAVTYRRLATRVSINVPRSQLPLAGDPVTVSGLLERQRSTGVWEPFGDRSVEIWFNDHQTQTSWKIADARTGTDGRYSVPTTLPGTGQYDVRFNQELPSDQFYVQSAGIISTLWVYHPTRFVGPNATPEPVGQGSKVTMTAQLTRPNATGDRAMVTGAPVDLQFSADGKTWRYVGAGRTNAEGKVSLSATATADGHWRLTSIGGPFGNAYSQIPDAPATSSADHVDVRYSTRMGSFNASPEPVTKGKAITVKGRLDRLIGTWKPAAANAAITIYFKPTGATTWTGMASIKTNSTGWFSKTFTASKDGYWMAKYNGSSTYLAIQGPGDFVDVR